MNGECPCRLFIHGGIPGPVVVDDEPPEEECAVDDPPVTGDLDDSSVRFSLLEPYDDPR